MCSRGRTEMTRMFVSQEILLVSWMTYFVREGVGSKMGGIRAYGSGLARLRKGACELSAAIGLYSAP